MRQLAQGCYRRGLTGPVFTNYHDSAGQGYHNSAANGALCSSWVDGPTSICSQPCYRRIPNLEFRRVSGTGNLMKTRL